MRAEMHPTTSGRSRNRSPRLSSTQSRVQPTTKNPQEWTEPPLQEPAASFEEHGGGPFGVLEDMQPLGTRPSAKVRARVKAEAPRKNNLNKPQVQASQAVSGADIQDTPETTPALEMSDAVPMEPLPGQPLPIVDDERDQDYTPRPSKKTPKTRLSRSAARHAASPAQLAVTNTPTPSSVSVSTPAASITPAPPPASSNKRSSRAMKTEDPTLAPAAASSPVPTAPRNIGAIVDAAVKKSQQAGKAELGAAIQEIYRQSQSDAHLSSLLLGILDQTATPKQASEFRDHIQRARKKLKGKGANSARKVKTKKSSSSPPPEMVPRQSIESPSLPPKPKISLKINRSKPAVKKASPVAVKPRTSSISSSSSLSSLTSMEDDAMAAGPAVSYQALNEVTNGDALAAAPVADGSLKRSSADAGNDDSEQIFLAKKQKLDETVNRDAPTEESHIRPDLAASQQKPKDPIIPPVKLTANGHSTANARSREVSMGSPLTDISSPVSSHKTTPKAAAMPAKVFKKKAKTKQSPVKKQLSNHEGDQNGTSRIESPAVGYDVNEESDNNDFCSACNGSGFLLCCDGCDKSFHFNCCDPPLTQDAQELDQPWYCFGCVAKRVQPQRSSRGLFSSLLTNLDKRNPTVFLLPQEIREYFAGVNTTKDGRFVEQLATKTRRGAGYDELPDNFKTKDAKGHVILCHQCGLSSLGRREIITCDQCSAHWHLDCLDPPLANAPYRDHTGRKIRDWICPLHIDHVLREMEVPRLADRQLQRERRIHMRRPRGAKIVDTSLNRGFINDGIIEIAPDSSDDDSEFYDEEVAGVVYRLPEKGIKLDFIDKVKKNRAPRSDDYNDVDARPAKRARTVKQNNNDFFFQRSFLEQRTALDLVGLANQQADLDFSGDQVSSLLSTLIAEAPEEVVKQIVEKERELSSLPFAPVQPEQDSTQQRKILELLQELILKKLATLDDR